MNPEKKTLIPWVKTRTLDEHKIIIILPATTVIVTQEQEAQRATYRAPEYNVPPFCLLISPKNTKLVEDVEILLPVKFR